MGTQFKQLQLSLTAVGSDRDRHELRTKLRSSGLVTQAGTEEMSAGAGAVVVTVASLHAAKVLARALELYVASRRSTVKVERRRDGAQFEVSANLDPDQIIDLLNTIITDEPVERDDV